MSPWFDPTKCHRDLLEEYAASYFQLIDWLHRGIPDELAQQLQVLAHNEYKDGYHPEALRDAFSRIAIEQQIEDE